MTKRGGGVTKRGGGVTKRERDLLVCFKDNAFAVPTRIEYRAQLAGIQVGTLWKTVHLLTTITKINSDD